MHTQRNPVSAFVRVLLFLLPLLSGCGNGSSGASPSFSREVKAQLDKTIADQMQVGNLPGVVVGIWIPGRGEYVTARGAANRDTGAARDTNAPFRIASITKTFTATVILQLADEKQLNVTDTLAKWYPDFPNADKITVDNLLRMRSGIPDSLDTAFLKEYYPDPTVVFAPSEMIRRSAARASEFTPPDQTTVYTNINYVLLGEIVQKVTGKTLGVQIQNRILTPLGMTHSVYPTDSTLSGGTRGYSLNAQSGKFEDKTVLNPAPAGGAGTMISTLADLRKYAKALYTGSLLKPETQQTRLAVQNLAGDPEFVGYGQGIVKIGKFYGHNGTIFGFSSEMFYLPERDAVIVINVNRLDLDDKSKSSNLFFALAKILFPADVNW